MKIMNKIIAVVICFFLLNGCDMFKKKPFDLSGVPSGEQIYKEIGENKKAIDKNADEVGNSAKTIKKEAVGIKDDTETAKGKLSEESKPKVEPILKKIDTHADKIIDESDKLKFTQGQLAMAVERLDKTQSMMREHSKAMTKLEKEYEKILKERDSLKEAESKKTAAIMRWLVLFSVVGIGISGALLLYGNKLGIAGAAACGITLVVAITIGQHIVLISWIGIGVVAVISVILIREVWLHRKAITEIVKTAELTKVELSDASNKIVFGTGDGEDHGLAGEIQSSSTEKIVSKEREKLDNIWNIAKEKVSEVSNFVEEKISSITNVIKKPDIIVNGTRGTTVIIE